MKFLERALDGQNKFWKYLVMFIAVYFGGNLIGGIPLVAVMMVAFAKLGYMPPIANNGMPDLSALNLPSSVTLALMIFVFAAVLIAFALLVKPMHRRTLAETINGRKKIRWNRICMGMLVWGVISVAGMAISYAISPQDFEWQFRPWQFLSLLAVVIVLLPFQTTCEEVLFRGYLAQGIGAGTHNRWMALAIPSVLFALLHTANPEVREFGFWMMMPQYLLIGLFFGLISILDDGIELALGAHFINNALAALITTHESSTLQTDALFKMTVEKVTGTDILVCAAWTALGLLILWRIYKWDFRILNRRIEAHLPPVPQIPADTEAEQI
ncbi:MAG: CPBP family intramembrane metalloprotease [Dysgonamonadaceae bacterium]|jgi:membrane protease YdiL (CAAX protease family)|nr:CPBP family intramembrane metalloprotease [Dysgonamonadaceae bacterium]